VAAISIEVQTQSDSYCRWWRMCVDSCSHLASCTVMTRDLAIYSYFCGFVQRGSPRSALDSPTQFRWRLRAGTAQAGSVVDSCWSCALKKVYAEWMASVWLYSLAPSWFLLTVRRAVSMQFLAFGWRDDCVTSLRVTRLRKSSCVRVTLAGTWASRSGEVVYTSGAKKVAVGCSPLKSLIDCILL
jgi:hypothetical protein